jgi:DNA (cytosine-5)-methyltransferase 1
MARKKSYVTLTDQFCGAGGSGQGAKKALDKVGGEVALALNHWKLATDTYRTNFPNTKVDCTDISASDPRRYPSTDGLITSPECTTHTPAGGNTHKQLKLQMSLFEKNVIDPATERSRATMWDVCRFAEYHKYNFIIVENVVEAKTRWALFDVWLNAMHVLGYKHKCVYQNSMFFHPTPQSRDRMYVVFWKKGNKAPQLEYTPRSYCHKCEKDTFAVQVWKNKEKQYGKYKQQYLYYCPLCSTIVDPYYYAAFNCIDWSDIGTRIGERKKPLSDNTVKRIEYGLDKYGKQPFVVNTCNKSHNETHEKSRSRSVYEQGFTKTTYNGEMLIGHPFLVDNKQNDTGNSRVRSAADTTNTMHCQPGVMVVSPPLIIKVENGSNLESARGSNEMLQAQLCRQTSALVVPPPFIINHNHSSKANSIAVGIGAQQCTDRYSLCTPPFLIEMHGTGKARGIDGVMNTATAKGVKTGLVTNESWNHFISHVYGHGYVKEVHEPIGSVRTKQGHELISYEVPELEECHYRMLKPKEIKLAMAFEDSYKILGNGRDQVKQLGNAVTPPVMEWLVQQCVESLN